MSSITAPEYDIIDTVDADCVDRDEATRAVQMLEAEATHRHGVALVIGHERLAVSADLVDLLLAACRLFAAGQDVIVGTPAKRTAGATEDETVEVSTGEAARLLGVSRPHVVELIKRRILSARPKSTVPGSHRQLYRRDVLTYKKQLLTSALTLAALEQAGDELDLDEVYQDDTARTR